MTNWVDFDKEKLLKLPKKEWKEVGKYDGILLVNTKHKHDSGYNLFAVIGCEKEEPKEIAGYMDDLRLDLLKQLEDKDNIKDIAIDCSMKGVFRIHSSKKICIGWTCSTTFWWLE